MTNLTRLLSFTAILLTLTPITSVYSMLRTLEWISPEWTMTTTCSESDFSLPHATRGTDQDMDDHSNNSTSNLHQEKEYSMEPRLYLGSHHHYLDAPFPILVPWLLSVILGISVPFVALLYDAYSRITQSSRRNERRQQIIKALRSCRRRVLTKSQERESCAICLASYSLGETIVCSSQSNCRHYFHEECMVNWLLKQQKQVSKGQKKHVGGDGQCPCCRQSFVCIPSR